MYSPLRTASSTRSTSPSDKPAATTRGRSCRSEEHTSELQSHSDLVCRLLLEKKKKPKTITHKIQHHTSAHSQNIVNTHHTTQTNSCATPRLLQADKHRNMSRAKLLRLE